MSNSKSTIIGQFGADVFNDTAMKKVLPPDVYKAVMNTMKDKQPLSKEVATKYAEALKDWALEHGATHFTHWFQPLTGYTAEKHDSFLSPTRDGDIITKFRIKELLKGEPDASSFPNGGIRATFEARGYTTWDPTSYAFIKDNTLCIPTAFISYSGETLDKKTPLLRSSQALAKQAQRILKLFGSDAHKVTSSVGAEQEYFLIDKSVFLKRKDLMYTGRTLFGAMPPKGQEMDDHYFGIIKPRVAKFMHEVDESLSRLGIIAKTEHNEVAPAQHELAPAYTNDNVACDQNQLTMELLRKIADKHGMACLLHEKPFKGINGSGKHLNWSLMTDTDVNLFEPGKSPQDNAQFLLMLSAVIRAVDEYQELLGAVVSSAGNNHRLGANEAPPAVISMFVGSDIAEVIENIVSGQRKQTNLRPTMNIGVDSLPEIPTDTTDRNRTSPFAFTGNKFEFRMPGSSFSIADPITVLNTIMADSLMKFADILEQATDFNDALNTLIRQTLTKHKRILFDGDGYSKEWLKEAEKRGLNIGNTAPDSVKALTDDKTVALMQKHGIFTQRELQSRQSILLENYAKTIKIEALTMLDMTFRDILPSTQKYLDSLLQLVNNKKQLGMLTDNDVTAELANTVNALLQKLFEQASALDKAVQKSHEYTDCQQLAKHFHTVATKHMHALRLTIDKLETICPEHCWGIPSYGELLYSVN